MDAERNSRTTPIGLARYAKEYLEAAILVDNEMGKDAVYSRISPIPAYFLLLHGIELTLKSFLRHKGLTVEQLSGKGLGHDLNALLARARELGLNEVHQLTEQDSEALALLIGANADHQLRYIQTGPKAFPPWGSAEPLAVRLHQAVAPIVGYESLRVSYP